MKKFIPILSIAVAMAACNTTPESGTNTASPLEQPEAITADTTGLSEFQQWKAQNELSDERAYNQTAGYAAAAPAKQRVYKAPVRRTAPVTTIYERPSSVENTGSGTRVSQTREDATANNEGTGSEGTAQGSGSSQGSGSTEAEKPAAKEGVSKAAKGAVIGGVGGAAAGAVINKKNRAAGAVIGGVIGAGGG
ncbi:MAG: hypothetical protein ABR502_12635, partial [Chitinophagaceae bacterium]